MNRSILAFSLIAVAAWTSGGLPAAAGVVEGVVVDASTGQPINDVYVHLYEIDRSRATVRFIDTEVTAPHNGQDGYYAVSVPANVDRMKLICMKGSTGVQTLYGPGEILPLSGRRSSVINVALDSSSGDTARTARLRMGRLRQVLIQERDFPPGQSSAWSESWVYSAVSQFGENPEFASEHIAAVGRLLGPEVSQIQPSNQVSYVINTDRGHEVSIWKTPEDLSQPRPFEGTSIVFPLTTERADQFDLINVAPTSDGLWVFGNRDTGDGLRTYQCRLGADLENVKGPWRKGIAADLVTSTAGTTRRHFVVKGAPDGHVIINNPEFPEESGRFEVGATPVTATAVSQNGRLFAGATVAGTYRVWQLTESGGVHEAFIAAEGRLNHAFPNSMAFSPDGRSLVVGTGLRELGNAVIAVNLFQDAGSEPFVVELDAPVTGVAFGRNANSMIVTTADGLAGIYSVQQIEGTIAINERFRLHGVQAFGLLPNGDAAALTVLGSAPPVAFPLEDFFDEDTFDTPVFDINRVP